MGGRNALAEHDVDKQIQIILQGYSFLLFEFN